MGGTAVDEVLARRFRIDRPPTLVARRRLRAQVAFSRMRSSQPMRGRSLAVPPGAAFSFHVPLSGPFFSNLWMAGKRKALPDARLGDTFLFDLNENPTVDLDTPFDSLRFYVPQNALDEMADDSGHSESQRPSYTATRRTRLDHVWICPSTRRRDGASGRRFRDVLRLYRARLFCSYRWRLWRLGDQTIRARRPGSVAAAPRLRIHRRQFG